MEQLWLNHCSLSLKRLVAVRNPACRLYQRLMVVQRAYTANYFNHRDMCSVSNDINRVK